MVYYATTQLVPTASRPLFWSRISSIFSRKNAPKRQMLHSLKGLHSSAGRCGSLIKSGAEIRIEALIDCPANDLTTPLAGIIAVRPKPSTVGWVRHPGVFETG